MMDRRSWPWKKKSSDKAVFEKAAAASDSAGPPAASAGSQGDRRKQDNYKNPKYVQISVESYARLTGLEDQVKSYEEQVKTLEDEVKELNGKLSAADAEMITKENLVKKHAKVAEDAVSGWEKADLEALTLKKQLESVSLLKLAAEDRVSHLDGALKECMRQIRNLKEEHEQKLHDVVLAKTKQCDQIKLDLESKIASLNQELFRSGAENESITRSLQERSNMLIKISEEKSQAEVDIKVLRSNIESCEREINSYKYELHIIAKELEIRNEEKNMSVRSADAANKQHLEGVKKIAKLEAECQRLRSLVRKKLPGPAALAQMKLEVENLGQDYGETRYRRSPVKLAEYSSEVVHKYHKENELLAERLFMMEEETKMLKEALDKRNSELQASRSICGKTVDRLQSLEALVQKSTAARPSVHIATEGSFSQNLSRPPSLTSLSEDGNNNEVSRAEKGENRNHLELMDDFVEMEKLAYLTEEKEICVTQELEEPAPHTMVPDISQIYDFAVLIGKEAKDVKGNSLDEDGFSQKLKELSVAFNEVVNGEIGLNEFVQCLSLVFSEASKLRFNFLGYKDNNEADPDCIDKVALPENKVVPESDGENIPCEGSFDSEIPFGGSFVPTSESDASSWKYSLEEFEKLKSEKDKVVMDLEKCTGNLESTESHLQETEQLLREARSQLTSAQKLNSLVETQLKCMVESYKSLETREEALQAEVNLLQAKIECHDNELLLEKCYHQEALAKCKDFQEQLERIENCPSTDIDAKTNHEIEITAAAEKLAECEETILLLGKQLKGGLRPRAEYGDDSIDPVEMGTVVGNDSPFIPSDSQAKTTTQITSLPINSKHQPTISGSSSSTTPEKHSRAFTRLFSTKAKNGNYVSQ